MPFLLLGQFWWAYLTDIKEALRSASRWIEADCTACLQKLEGR